MTWFFDGVRQYGQADCDLSAFPTITLSWWSRWAAFADDDAVMLEFTASGESGVGGFGIRPNWSGGVSHFLIGLSGNVGLNYKGYPRPSVAVEHHYFLRLDFNQAAANEILQFAIDGVDQTATTSSSTSANTGNFANSQCYFCARSGASLFGNCTFRDFFIFDGTQSVDALQLYRMGLASHERYASLVSSAGFTKPIAYWPMDGRQIDERDVIGDRPSLLLGMPFVETYDDDEEEGITGPEIIEFAGSVESQATCASVAQHAHTSSVAASAAASVDGGFIVVTTFSGSVEAVATCTITSQQTHTSSVSCAAVVSVSGAFAGDAVPGACFAYPSAVVSVSGGFRLAIGPPYCLCTAQWVGSGESVGTSGSEAGQWAGVGGEAGQMFCECEDE